jgi:hypothetical protein
MQTRPLLLRLLYCALAPAIALVLAPGIPAARAAAVDLLHGVGVMGDSYSEEYQFPQDSPDRSRARNYVEILRATRGFNFGRFSTADWGGPRRHGYEYDWALSGSTTTRMLSQGQHTGLAAQVTAGQVTLAIVQGGEIDFYDGYGQPDQLGEISARTMNNVQTAVGTILAADPRVRVVVTTPVDLTDTPFVRESVAGGAYTRETVGRVDAALRSYDAQLEAWAARDPRVAVLNLFDTFYSIMGPPSYQFGGVPIERRQPDGSSVNRLYLDQFHYGTVGQGIIANALIDTIDHSFGLQVQPLSPAEIFAFANAVPGATPLPGSPEPPAAAWAAVALTLLRKWRRRGRSMT